MSCRWVARTSWPWARTVTFGSTQQDQSRLVRIAPQGGARVFALPLGLGQHGIAFDRHGGMWITLQFVNEIARVNLDGRIIRHLPDPHAG